MTIADYLTEAQDFINNLSNEDKAKILERVDELRDLFVITEEGATIMAVELAKKGGD